MSNILDRTLKDKEFVSCLDDSTIICRCEEITKGEVRWAIYNGMYTMNEVKKFLRVGMGLCQGQTCSKLVRSIIAKELGIKPVEIEIPVPRPPVRPLPMKNYANDRIKE